MSEMTLDEARRRIDAMDPDAVIAVGSHTMRVILAALPAPEKRTPGQTLGEALYPGADYAAMPPYDKKAMEHSAITVLREHAAGYLLKDDACDNIAGLFMGHSVPVGNSTRKAIRTGIRAAVKARLGKGGQ